MPSVMPVAEPGNDFLDSARFFLLCIKFCPWNCWSQILNVSAYISMIWSLKTTFWECVDNFESIRSSVEGFGIQNCEDLVRMGGCEQGGADYCCACSESANGDIQLCVEIFSWKLFLNKKTFFSKAKKNGRGLLLFKKRSDSF